MAPGRKVHWHQRPDSSQWSLRSQVRVVVLALTGLCVVNLICTGTVQGDVSHLHPLEAWRAPLFFSSPGEVAASRVNVDGFAGDE